MVYWKSNQRMPLQPQTLGEQIKKRRLELHWLQADRRKPATQNRKRIAKFLECSFQKR
jgi:hypothetical protein